jgi:hypothetical protein
MERGVLTIRPRGGLELLLPENISDGLYPVCVTPPNSSHYKIPESLWSNLVIQSEKKSLRCLSREFGVSHESIRRTLLGINRDREANI